MTVCWRCDQRSAASDAEDDVARPCGRSQRRRSSRACATLLRRGPRLANRGLYHSCEKRIKRRAGEFRLQSPRQTRLQPLQKGRDERPKVPAAGLSGRHLRPAEASWAAADRRPPGARARRARGRPAHLPGRPQEHQHAGLPGSRSLRAVRLRGGAEISAETQLPAVRGRSAHLRPVRVVRPGQPLRVHGADHRRACRRRTRATPARTSARARRSSGKPRRPKWTVPGRPSTISSSFR